MYGDLPLGLYIVRGDAIVLLGRSAASDPTLQTPGATAGELSEELETAETYPEQVPAEDIIAMHQAPDATFVQGDMKVDDE